MDQRGEDLVITGTVPGGVATLNHRLMAVKPPAYLGKKKGDGGFKKSTPAPFLYLQKDTAAGAGVGT